MLPRPKSKRSSEVNKLTWNDWKTDIGDPFMDMAIHSCGLIGIDMAAGRSVTECLPHLPTTGRMDESGSGRESMETKRMNDDCRGNLVDMPELERFYTYVKKDEDGVKTLHLKAIFEDRSEVEVKGSGDLAFLDGGKGDMRENAKEVGLMYAIVRRMCGIRNFRQTLEGLMSREAVSVRRKGKGKGKGRGTDEAPDGNGDAGRGQGPDACDGKSE